MPDAFGSLAPSTTTVTSPSTQQLDLPALLAYIRRDPRLNAAYTAGTNLQTINDDYRLQQMQPLSRMTQGLVADPSLAEAYAGADPFGLLGLNTMMSGSPRVIDMINRDFGDVRRGRP